MIKKTGIFYENDYFRHAYDIDKTAPKNMGQTHGVVLALDVAKRPLKLEMSAERLENASDEEVEAFRERFADIDPKSLAPLPLQKYDGDIAVRRTVDQLISSGVDGVTVIVDPTVADNVQAALEGCSGEVAIVDLDAEAVDVLEVESDGIQIEFLGRGLILWVRGQVVLPKNCDSLLFVHADSVGFEPRHYRRMRTALEEDPSIDFATAWVEWRAGLPLLLPLSFIDRLSQPLVNKLPKAQGAQQLSCQTYRGRHVIMDEDKLYGPYVYITGAQKPGALPASALGEAIEYLNMIGMDKVEEHIAAMTAYALRVASLIPGIHILGDHSQADGATGLLCYTFAKLESIQVSMLLGSMGVAVRCGAHCAVQLALALGLPGTTRISFGPYTTKTDIEAWGYAMSVIADLSRNEVPRS
jgi:hypothetical protein